MGESNSLIWFNLLVWEEVSLRKCLLGWSLEKVFRIEWLENILEGVKWVRERGWYDFDCVIKRKINKMVYLEFEIII